MPDSGPTELKAKFRVGLAANLDTHQRDIGEADLARLSAVAEFAFLEFNESSSWD